MEAAGMKDRLLFKTVIKVGYWSVIFAHFVYVSGPYNCIWNIWVHCFTWTACFLEHFWVSWAWNILTKFICLWLFHQMPAWLMHSSSLTQATMLWKKWYLITEFKTTVPPIEWLWNIFCDYLLQCKATFWYLCRKLKLKPLIAAILLCQVVLTPAADK